MRALVFGNARFRTYWHTPLRWETITGRFIAVVFEVLNPDDPLIIRPVTAYDVPEPTE
jgi:hypothetical protein